MSKHFELMQQMEKEQRSSSGTAATMVAPAERSAIRVQGRYASEEALRLVQQLFLLQTQEPPRVVVFAGVDHGNGCSRICAEVAETLASNARGRVCLVEANFRSPSLPGMFGVANHHGLTEALRREGPIDSFAKPVNQGNLWLLSSGALAADSSNLLTTDSLGGRIGELRKEFEFVIVDAAPLSRYADAMVLGQLADGVVLVLEADTTRREVASSVTQNLRAAKIPILAAVLNKRTFPIPDQLYNRL